VREAERERIARGLQDLVLQDHLSALQVAEAHRLTRQGDEWEGAEDVREMIDSLTLHEAQGEVKHVVGVTDPN
jgi:signal transduction histidine kinase